MPYSKVILETHAFIPKDELKKPLDVLREKFTLVSKFEKGVAIELFKETATHFGIPLHHTNLAPFCNHVLDMRTTGTKRDFRMRGSFVLRENQAGLVRAFQQAIHEGRTGFLLALPTGAGKTVLAIRMLCELGTTALVIVPRQQLVAQWIERILEFTDLQRDDIGIAMQDKCEYQGKKIVVGMLHSICKDKYPEEFKNYFGAVVWDEVHIAAAQSFSETIGMFPAKYRLGMSATMRRKDGMDDVYRFALGETLLGPREIATLIQPEVYIIPYRTKKKQDWIESMDDVKFRRGKLLSELAKDRTRNGLICEIAKEIMASGRRCVIFSDRVEQLKTIQGHLEKKKVAGVLFTGSTKAADRERILKESQLILATYGVMAMGIDVPDLRAVIFATPSSDVAQAVGRILRVCEGAATPIVADIVDTAYEDCLRWAEKRQLYYRETARAQMFDGFGPDAKVMILP